MQIRSVRELGAVLRSRRNELRLSQVTVADAANVSRQWLSEMEKGKATIEIGRCLRVIDALALDLRVEPRVRPSVSDLRPAIDLDQFIDGLRDR